MPRSDKVIAPFKQVIWGNLSLNVDWKKKCYSEAFLKLYYWSQVIHESKRHPCVHMGMWRTTTSTPKGQQFLWGLWPKSKNYGIG